MKRKVLAALFVSALGTFAKAQPGKELLAKKLLKKNAEVDVTFATETQLFLTAEQSNPVQKVKDGTDMMYFSCPIPKEAASLSKPMNKPHHEYVFVITIQDATALAPLKGSTIVTKSYTIADWNTILNQSGTVNVEVSTQEFLKLLKDGSGNIHPDNITFTAELIAQKKVGKALLSTGTFTLESKGAEGKWGGAKAAQEIASYQQGGKNFEPAPNSAKWNKMLTYTKNHWPDADIIHLKVGDSGVEDHYRNFTYITVTMNKDGECMRVEVNVWEAQTDGSLHSYVPQHVDDLSCTGLEDIRNVK